MGQYISLAGDDAIPVRVNGTERIGDLEAWRQEDDGSWSGYVRYLAPMRTWTSLYVGWFSADDIKPDEQPDDAHEDAGDASPPEAPQP